jgi:putative ABC transport system ATP-binding protein
VTPTARFVFDHVSVVAPQGWRLRDATGAVPRDGVCAIVGPSGSGKSTLLRLCNRLEVPVHGVVELDGVDLSTLDPLSLRRRVGMVFQRPTPFAGTGRDNLRVADPEIDNATATQLLARVRLDASFLDRDALQLSGGEAQRLCLARSLAAHPEVLLMDEVTSSVDGATRVALEELAVTCARVGTTVLWVTHDLQQAQRVAQHVIVVIDGRIAHAAAVDAVVHDAPPEVVRFFEEDFDAE